MPDTRDDTELKKDAHDSAGPIEKPVRLTKEGKPFRAQRRGKINQLPPALLKELDEKLATNGFRSFRQLSQWLEERGGFISPSALNYRKKHNIDPMLRGVKIATQEAEKIVKFARGDDGRINRAVTTLLQTKLFDMLCKMNTTLLVLDDVERARKHSHNIMAARAQRKIEAQTSAPAPAADGQPALPPPADGQAKTVEAEVCEQPKYPGKGELAAITILTRNALAIEGALLDRAKWEAEERRKIAAQVEVANHKISEAVRDGGLSPDAEAKIRAALLEITI